MNTELTQTCCWSDCGVITMKICDRNFRCGECPIDLALHNHSSIAAGDASGRPEYMLSIRSLLKNLFYSESCLYLKNHVVFRHLLANAYLAGLSDMMRLLFFNFELSIFNGQEKPDLTPYFELNSPLLKFRLTCPARSMLYIPQKELPVGNQWNLIAELGAIPTDMLLTKKNYINQKMKITEEFLTCLSSSQPDNSGSTVEEQVKFSYELFGERSFVQLAEFLGAEPV